MQDHFYQTPFKKRSNASQLRAQARDVLRERWGLAIGVFLLACLLGLSTGSFLSSDSSLTAKIEADPLAFLEKLRVVDELLIENGVMDAVRYVVRSVIGVDVFVGLMSAAVFSAAFSLFVGAPVTVGYHRFLMDYADGRPDARVRTLFSAFSFCYWKAVSLRLLLGVIYWGVGVLTAAVLFVVLTMAGLFGSGLLLTLAFVVLAVGVAVSILLNYHFSLCYYIMAEYADLSVVDVLRNSHLLMRGNKWRLFCLQISFIGWILLAALTAGIGFIAVTPYMNAATTALYAEISGRDTAKDVEFPSLDPDDYFPNV